MFAYCTKCRYDSGDCDDTEELAEKVAYDGGSMKPKTTVEGKQIGWIVVCPRCDNSYNTEID